MRVSIIERARRYVASMASSIQGSNGSAALFAVAVILIRGFGLDEPTALMLLREFNDSKALPPWSERDLIAKLRSAHKDGKMPYGHLLQDDDRSPPSPAPRWNSVSSAKPARQPKFYTAEELAAKAIQRAKWSPPTAPDAETMLSIAESRWIPREAVEILVELGMLHLEPVYDHADGQQHPAFVMAFDGFRQARRLDGIEWTSKEGERSKSKNLPGSLSVGFFGHVGPSRHPNGKESILLVEGVIGFLEAVGALLLAGPNPSSWQILAAHSANASRFMNTPDLLASIAGRHVRIIQDSDGGGKEAATAWAGELTAAGCTVEIVTLPEGCKDLGDVLKAPTDEALPVLSAILKIQTEEETI